jgi:hypothetical protein
MTGTIAPPPARGYGFVTASQPQQMTVTDADAQPKSALIADRRSSDAPVAISLRD